MTARKRSKFAGAAFALAAVFIVVAIIAFSMIYYVYGMRGAVLKSGDVYIPTGSSLEEQAAQLYDGKFIKDSSEYQVIARRAGVDTKVYPGKFALKEGMTYRQLISVLSRNRQTPVKLTFNNIRTPEKLAGVVSEYIEADSLELVSILRSSEAAKRYGFKPSQFMGMFIPNTYEFYWNTSAEKFLDRMKKEYDKFWVQNNRDKKREALEMSREDVSTLASIVIEETKVRSEMPLVAGVYINRLRINMPLQADPTVKFALGDPTIKRILFKHLEVESPYNTYKNQGLPPGVICVPSIAAIDAVLNYKKSDYLYFCASPALDGTHRFAENLAQHSINAKAYAAALNKMGL